MAEAPQGGDGAQGLPDDGRLTLANMRRRLAGKPWGRLADLIAGLMMLSFSALGYIYAGRAPGLDPITVWPFMLWAGLYIAVGIVLSPLLRWRRTLLVVGFPLLTALLLCEEPRYLLRPLWHDPSREVSAAAERHELLRVVTLNCGSGSEAAVHDALGLDPDILLLQEIPGSFALDRMLPEGWQQAGWGDCAVLVRGEVYADEHSRYLAHEMHVVRAVPAGLAEPTPITVISTHLVQPSLRTNILRPGVWRNAVSLRESRVRTIENLLHERDRYGDDLPVIIGGDFNAGDLDSLLPPLAANGLTDAFGAVGTGWPNTITAGFPIERIDYVWVDERFEPLDGRVIFTPNSDHRMVVVDVALK